MSSNRQPVLPRDYPKLLIEVPDKMIKTPGYNDTTHLNQGLWMIIAHLILKPYLALDCMV